MNPEVKNQTEAFMAMLEMVSPLAQTVAGYREECIRQGFSPTAAEEMAVALHQTILISTFQQGTR